MKISSYDVSFESKHQYSSIYERSSQIKGIFFNGLNDGANNPGDSTEISLKAKQQYFNSGFAQTDKTTEIRKIDGNLKETDPDKNLISKIVSHVSGRTAEFTSENVMVDMSEVRPPSIDLNTGNSIKVLFAQTEKIETNEQTLVDTAGLVTTEDGREISFGMHLSMERNFVSEKSFNAKVTMSQLIDPLVIQFEDGPPSLSDKFFSFDLNSDGENEKLKALGKGSGFLAFDINEDGIINDGSELFGTSSGNGFADLAMYDDDKNGWIDENDEIFSKLSIWRPETDGEEEYMSGLLSSDVGAIYLGYAQSPHTITDSKGNTEAVLRSTGMFLKETGEAGHVYQLDLADSNKLEQKNMNKTETEPQGSQQTPELSLQPLKKADYFSVFKERIDRLKESLETRRKEHSNNSGSIFSELGERIRERLDKLLEMLEGKKSLKDKNMNKYGTEFEKTLKNIDMSA
ncbi:MAG: hypothetical protein H6681_06690 [Desulfobacteraceae bacterium]|nr:hypothetical protein [Desulfobacteraceae bacterium]